MKVENNIPLPEEINYTKTALEIIDILKPGESVWFKKPDSEKIRRAVFVTLYRKKISDKKFVTRTEGIGIRFWRV